MKKPLRAAALLPALAAALLSALLCTACGQKGEDLPPPDLTGVWIQDGWENSAYYQFAVIAGDEILVYWYKPSERSLDLYWAGTYDAPDTGKEPYQWTSETRRGEHREANRFTLVDKSKTFLYKGGNLIHDVMVSHLKMAVSMTRIRELDIDPSDAGIPDRFLEDTQAEPETPPAASPAIQPAPEERTPPPAPPNQLQ